MSEKQNKAIQCNQCGAPELKQTSGNSLRCPFCGSVYSLTAKQPTVIIKKGANVTFWKNAHVIIKGGLEIEDGADVQIDGKITLVERASTEAITAAKIKLKNPD